MDTWTGRAPFLLLELLTTSTRYGGRNGSNQCGMMSSAHSVFLRGDDDDIGLKREDFVSDMLK